MSKYDKLNSRMIEIMDAISQPAAPYYEGLVANAIENTLTPLKSNPNVQVFRDRYGNLVACYRHPEARYTASLAAAAHTDHPGYHLVSAEGKEAVASIQGGLPRDERLPGSAMLIFRGDYNNRGTIVDFADDEKSTVRVKLDENWEGGVEHAWGVPDVERFLVDGDLIRGRAMDDLVGCAQQIAALELFVQEEMLIEYTAVFNRAEEVGFVGAVGACELGTIPTRSIVLCLEASKELEGARPGDGIILRTGDRQSVFDPVVSELLEKAGEKSTENGYPFQKKRMDGGTCEASLYVAYGYETGALAVPLINYHNQGDGAIEAEAIHINDLAGGVVMQVELAKLLVDAKRVPRDFFRENRRAWFMDKVKLLLDSGRSQG